MRKGDVTIVAPRELSRGSPRSFDSRRASLDAPLGNRANARFTSACTCKSTSEKIQRAAHILRDMEKGGANLSLPFSPEIPIMKMLISGLASSRLHSKIWFAYIYVDRSELGVHDMALRSLNIWSTRSLSNGCGIFEYLARVWRVRRNCALKLSWRYLKWSTCTRNIFERH